MVFRVRVEAYGYSAADCENSLRKAADAMDVHLGLEATRGEQVIEKDSGEPEGSLFHFKGRLILHPNVADSALQLRHPNMGGMPDDGKTSHGPYSYEALC